MVHYGIDAVFAQSHKNRSHIYHLNCDFSGYCWKILTQQIVILSGQIAFLVSRGAANGSVLWELLEVAQTLLLKII